MEMQSLKHDQGAERPVPLPDQNKKITPRKAATYGNGWHRCHSARFMCGTPIVHQRHSRSLVPRPVCHTIYYRAATDLKTRAPVFSLFLSPTTASISKQEVSMLANDSVKDLQANIQGDLLEKPQKLRKHHASGSTLYDLAVTALDCRGFSVSVLLIAAHHEHDPDPNARYPHTTTLRLRCQPTFQTSPGSTLQAQGPQVSACVSRVEVREVTDSNAHCISSSS